MGWQSRTHTCTCGKTRAKPAGIPIPVIFTIVDHSEATLDYLALLTHNGIPFHELKFKEGWICSLMCNMSVQKGSVKNA
jgi:hypothetical protein